MKLAIYLYEENIIDARSYGNRITSVLATLKKGNTGAFQRTLIHMQYVSTAKRINGEPSNPGYFTAISDKPLETTQTNESDMSDTTANEVRSVEAPVKEPDELESDSKQNESESQQ